MGVEDRLGFRKIDVRGFLQSVFKLIGVTTHLSSDLCNLYSDKVKRS
jgi:hypothetical protein